MIESLPTPPPRARTAAAIIATAGLALLAAACGGTSNPPGPATQANGALAFSRCMRSHRVPNFPDPNSSGELPKSQLEHLDVNSPRFQTAESACIHLLPNRGQPSTAALQQSWSDFRTFARCMRSHGVPNWPDPTRYPQHPERPTFELQPLGIDPNSTQISAEIRKCEPLLHGTNPQHLGDSGS